MDGNTVNTFDSSVTATAEAGPTSGCYLDFFEVQNPNTSQVFLQLFDAALASVTLGTTAPTLSLLIPAGNAGEYGARSEVMYRPPNFRTALTYAITTTATGSTAPTSACQLNLVTH